MVKPDSLLMGKRCLVLDDEFLIALDIQQTLELSGAAHVACVATASEALALLRADPDFDVAVLDVKLSGADRNSLGVAALLSAKGTPFVFLTGYGAAGVELPFSHVPTIAKPFHLPALEKALDYFRNGIHVASP